MPQLLLIALAGAGIWVGYKWYRKEQERVRSILDEAENELRSRDEASIPNLKQDPETGIYKPANKD